MHHSMYSYARLCLRASVSYGEPPRCSPSPIHLRARGTLFSPLLPIRRRKILLLLRFCSSELRRKQETKTAILFPPQVAEIRKKRGERDDDNKSVVPDRPLFEVFLLLSPCSSFVTPLFAFSCLSVDFLSFCSFRLCLHCVNFFPINRKHHNPRWHLGRSISIFTAKSLIGRIFILLVELLFVNYWKRAKNNRNVMCFSSQMVWISELSIGFPLTWNGKL